MDAKRLIGWLVPVVARGISWALASWLGLEAAQADSAALAAAEALGALALVAVSVWTSVAGRRKLLAETPPGSAPHSGMRLDT
jgi:hypothetical protein